MANLERLLTIAEMTNKYQFTSTETWAVDALYNVISGLHGAPQAQYDLDGCSSLWMKRLLEVALLCQHITLRNHVAERWVKRIISRDLRPIHALEIADRSGIRQLQGYAYYVQLLEMDDDFEPGVVEDGKQYSRLATALAHGNGDASSTSARTGTPASLTCKQRERLLIGHWSLSRLWQKLQSKPPVFQQSDECANHEQGCLSTWAQVWEDLSKVEATLKLPPQDVPGRLRAMEQYLFQRVDIHVLLSRAMTRQCQRGAFAALKAAIKEAQEDLADHFAICIHTS